MRQQRRHTSGEGRLRRWELAFGGTPRRHGWTQCDKSSRWDPPRGPGTDFDQISNCRCLKSPGSEQG
eukprot:3635767-Pyramimonas_sp.AAC.1